MDDRISHRARGQVVHLDPGSEAAEAFRIARTGLYFGVGSGSVKTTVVTSPMAGEGKSTVASNLAIAMAQAGERILLLDCDFRKPSQHLIFEIEPGIGLSEYLAGRTTLEGSIVRGAVAGLDVLPCGPLPARPSEILNSRVFAELVRRLSESYDRIVIDSPPVLPVPDARILSALSAQTVLVLRAQVSTRNDGDQAQNNLRGVGANLVGVIVNNVPRSATRYGYYSSYPSAAKPREIFVERETESY